MNVLANIFATGLEIYSLFNPNHASTIAVKALDAWTPWLLKVSESTRLSCMNAHERLLCLVR